MYLLIIITNVFKFVLYLLKIQCFVENNKCTSKRYKIQIQFAVNLSN